ncbi:hypothetical protein ACOZ4L_16915 (plasmid) [Haloplanus ruber]|uniref:hypothetical protein n=1 Tax=Haloplanus ruber TaxID=869892 RepID=UPI002111CD59|nr:hypothetical protein [Haloplanus ruber]
MIAADEADTNAATVTISPDSPPENTQISHQIEATHNASTSGEWLFTFPDSYSGEISKTSVSSGRRSEKAQFTTRIVDGLDQDGTNESVRVVYHDHGSDSQSTALTLEFSLNHPPVTTNSTFEVHSYHNNTRVSTETFTVREVTESRTGASGTFDTRSGSGFVYAGATVYRGEEDIQFAGNLTNPLIPTNASSEPLETPVPKEIAQTRYTTDGSSSSPGVRVDQPEVRNLKIKNRFGDQVGGGTVSSKESETVSVIADYDFAAAEDLEITVQNQDEIDVTQELLTGSKIKSGRTDGTVTWQLQFPKNPSPSYTISVSGSDDLTTGSAQQSSTITVNRNSHPTIQWNQSATYQGSRTTFKVTGAANGQEFLVTVPWRFFQTDVTRDGILKDLSLSGDVEEVGIITEDGQTHPRREYLTADTQSPSSVYLRLNVDDRNGVARGQFDTGVFAVGDIDIRLHENRVAAADQIMSSSVVDTASFTVQENHMELDAVSPYYIGTETSVSGNATSGVDHVGYYVRDSGEYRLLNLNTSGTGLQRTISVNSSGKFQLEDQEFTAANGSGNDVIEYPGVYRFVAVGSTGEATAENFPQTLSLSDLQERTHASQQVAVKRPNITLSLSDQLGEISTSDKYVNISGEAPGDDEIVVVALDERGVAVVRSPSVNDEEYLLSTVDISSLAEGSIDVYAISNGIDQSYGDGSAKGNTTDTAEELEMHLSTLEERPLTQDQFYSRLVAQTTNDSGSDDKIAHQRVQLTDSRIEVQAVSELRTQERSPISPGSTAVISGTTNLQAKTNAIELLLRTPGNQTVLLTVTDWQSGTWTTTVSLEPYDSGLYSVRPNSEVDIVQPTTFVVKRKATTATPQQPGSPPAGTDPAKQYIQVQSVSRNLTSGIISVEYQLTNHGDSQSAALLELTKLETSPQIQFFRGDISQNLSGANPPGIITSQLNSGESTTVTVGLAFSSNVSTNTANISGRVTFQTDNLVRDTVRTTINLNRTTDRQEPTSTGTQTPTPPQSSQPRDPRTAEETATQQPPTTTGDGTGFTLSSGLLTLVVASVAGRRLLTFLRD